MNAPTPLAKRNSAPPDGEMLPQHPPSAAVRGIAWLLIAMFATALAVACLVRLPETVRCPFVLVPEEGSDPVQASHAAVVAQVRVKEGQEVQAGEVLFVLRSDDLRNWRTQLSTLEEDERSWQDRKKKLDSAYENEIAIKDEELAQVEREQGFREKLAAAERDLLGRDEALAKERALAEVAVLRQRLAVAQAEKELAVGQKIREQVRLQRQALETARVRQRNEEQTELEKARLRLTALRTQLGQSEGDTISIRAPYDGVVLSVAQRNSGNIVAAGAELCQLARRDARPRARLLPVEADLPRLTSALPVRFFFEAFPYQRHGTLLGRLVWVSPSSMPAAAGGGFFALASLDQEKFRGSGGGAARPVRLGMKGEARVRVGERTLIEYAFEPLRRLRESGRWDKSAAPADRSDPQTGRATLEP